MKLLAIAFAIALSTSPSLAQSESRSEAGQQAAPQQKQSAAPEGSNLTNETPAPTSRQKPKRIIPPLLNNKPIRASARVGVPMSRLLIRRTIRSLKACRRVMARQSCPDLLGRSEQQTLTSLKARPHKPPHKFCRREMAQARTRLDERGRSETDFNAAVQGAADQTNLPESMRIQQQTDRANPPGPDLITKGGASPAQSSSTGDTPVERSRPRSLRAQPRPAPD